MCKSISSKSPAILEHFWGACAPKIREPISSQSPANLQFVYKNDWNFFNKTIIWCFGVVECTWCSRKLLSIFLFSFCVTWSCMLGYSKKRYIISRRSCFPGMAWSHGMANGWVEKLFCTSDIDVSNTRRLSGNENVSKRLSSHPPRTAHRK